MVSRRDARIPEEVRQSFRQGNTNGTAGLATNYVQTNLVIVPEAYALDFLTFCMRNPKPCPVVEVCSPGDPVPRITAPSADLRTDLPQYRVYRDGVLDQVVPDIRDYWRDDLVSVLLGCSYTFEWALLEHGLPIAHIEQNKVVPMYITTIDCEPAGQFHGPMVVSMRPFHSQMISEVVSLTARFPAMHGSPVAVGDPSAIGIKDLKATDFGDAVTLSPGDIPVFWACGVTPQAVALASKLPLVITHDPGHMFITDRLNAEYQL